MSILAFILGLPGRIKAWLFGGGLALALVAILRFKWRRQGHDEARREAVEEQNRRVAKGAKAAEQAREAQRKGRSPEDGVRGRDRRWR